ncbi:hypothetical protein A8V01_14950 [Novosphingobium guangzhouense]|uniref:Uncharacterized protein n=1 Tax=Novosphingobium guangzhouense TaxID=1850347 RepID=A0A2K2G3N2_9SPHN|nr:hypothetical protein A8V01_14950 [Novosphingobium guangzhouense]
MWPIISSGRKPMLAADYVVRGLQDANPCPRAHSIEGIHAKKLGLPDAFPDRDTIEESRR